MAVNRLETSENTPRTKVLANGAIYDLERKRIVGNRADLAVKDTQITSDTAGVYLAKKQENKRLAVQQAANEAVESGHIRASYGDLAFVAEITKVMMMRATTPKDSRGVDAAKWLIQEAGIGERQQAEQSGGGTVVHTIDPAVMALLAQIAEQQNGFDNSNYHKQVIEAETSAIEDVDGG